MISLNEISAIVDIPARDLQYCTMEGLAVYPTKDKASFHVRLDIHLLEGGHCINPNAHKVYKRMTSEQISKLFAFLSALNNDDAI